MSLLVITIFVVLFLTRPSKNNFLEKKNNILLFIHAAKKLQNQWLQGDFYNRWKRGELKCSPSIGDYRYTDDSYLMCNPDYIQCYLDDFYKHKKIFHEEASNKKSIRINIEKRDNKYYQIISNSKGNSNGKVNYGIEVVFFIEGDKKNKMSFIFEDSCNESYLPQGFYVQSLDSSNKQKFLWNNLNRNIFFDKFLVTNRDVFEWTENYSKVMKSIISKIVKPDRGSFSHPATFLTLDQMKLFCAYRGKQLMSANIYDAATFYRKGNLVNMKKIKYMGPLPWTSRRYARFDVELGLDGSSIINEQICSRAYFKECLQVGLQNAHSVRSGSSVDLFEILGGNLEYIKNSITPSKNLKASSKFFNFKSVWHRLGARAYWDGAGFSEDNYGWEYSPGKEIMPVDISNGMGVGFRCMRSLNL